MYIVKICVKTFNNQEKSKMIYNNIDYHLIEIETNQTNEEMAAKMAIDYYYKTYWTNTEWRKEEFEKELKNIKSSIKPKYYKELKEQFEYLIRKDLNCTDKSIQDFESMDLYYKITYLESLGCNLAFFVMPKKLVNKFEKVKI